jgi:hypothetical protein
MGVVVLLVAGTYAYARFERAEADATLAVIVTSKLMETRPTLSAGLGPLIGEGVVHWGLLAHSDSAKRMPDFARAIDHMRNASMVALYLSSAASRGEPTPYVSEVPGGAVMVAALPEVARSVVGTGPAARFDNKGNKLSRQLVAIAFAQLDRANEIRLEKYPTHPFEAQQMK